MHSCNSLGARKIVDWSHIATFSMTMLDLTRLVEQDCVDQINMLLRPNAAHSRLISLMNMIKNRFGLIGVGGMDGNSLSHGQYQ